MWREYIMREIRSIEFDSDFEHRIQPEICFEFRIFGSARHFQLRKVRRNQVQYKCWRILNTPCHKRERYRNYSKKKSFRDTEREWRKRQKEEQENDKRECDWVERKETMRLRLERNWVRMSDRVKKRDCNSIDTENSNLVPSLKIKINIHSMNSERISFTHFQNISMLLCCLCMSQIF